MANMDWSALPSVIIVEIFTYLSVNDKLAAAATCKAWRHCLFSPSTWRRIIFKVNSYENGNERSKYLASKCGRFVKIAVIELDSMNPSDVRDCLEILERLAINPYLQKLGIRPTSCRLEYQDRTIIDKYIEVLKIIMKTSKKLQAVSFGCIEEILDHAETFVSLVGQYQANSLKALHMSSVKEDPENYAILNITPNLFTPFLNLQTLSIDYDYLSNDLLRIFSNSNRIPLLCLNIHVHAISPHHLAEDEEAWKQLVKHSPNLEVSLTLLHSLRAPEALIDILQPSMHLTHYRQYFCGEINTPAIDNMARFYSDTLQSIAILDSLDDSSHPCYYNAPDEDPFVMLAWRCLNLKKFTLIGYNVFDEDIIAIARLRGSHLLTFDIPDCCICYVEDEFRPEPPDYYRFQMIREVSHNLGRPWEPMPDNNLHPAIWDWNQDADGVYMPTILQDQCILNSTKKN